MSKVHLRAMEPEDLDMLYRIENDSKLWDVGVTNVPYSRFLLHEYMSNITGDIYTDRQVRLMVENEEHEVIGMADIINFDARHCKAEIGIVIEKPYRHKGYGEETLLCMADYSHRILHLHQLYAYVSTDNQKAISLFSKVGFHASATLADWLYDGTRYYSAVLMQLVFNPCGTIQAKE